MTISRWDYIRRRNLDRLTHRQGLLRQGIGHLLTIAVSYGIIAGSGLVEADTALRISGGMVAASLVMTAIGLVRKEGNEADPVTLPPEEVARLAQ